MTTTSRAWTPEEDAYLALHWAGCTDGELAVTLDRTEFAIGSRRCVLGFRKRDDRPKPHGVKPWTAGEDQHLRKGFGSGLSDLEIAEWLGRTKGAVAQRRSTIGLLRAEQPEALASDTWSDDADHVLRFLFHRGCGDEEIARRLSTPGYSYTAVSVKCRRGSLGLWRVPAE